MDPQISERYREFVLDYLNSNQGRMAFYNPDKFHPLMGRIFTYGQEPRLEGWIKKKKSASIPHDDIWSRANKDRIKLSY